LEKSDNCHNSRKRFAELTSSERFLKELKSFHTENPRKKIAKCNALPLQNVTGRPWIMDDADAIALFIVSLLSRWPLYERQKKISAWNRSRKDIAHAVSVGNDIGNMCRSRPDGRDHPERRLLVHAGLKWPSCLQADLPSWLAAGL